MTTSATQPDELVRLALSETRERVSMAPTLAMYRSIETQLEYLLAVLEKRQQDTSRLKDIMVGLYAARELEQSDPDYADRLFRVQQIADRMAKGLKIA